MPTRSEIQDTLAASQKQVSAYFEGLSPEALERPCTASGVPGEAPWRAKDHYAHLTSNEQGIQALLRLSITSESLPGNLSSMSPQERQAWANQRNQNYVNAHRDDTMETLRAHLSAAHQETLDLLERRTRCAALVMSRGRWVRAARMSSSLSVWENTHLIKHLIRDVPSSSNSILKLGPKRVFSDVVIHRFSRFLRP